MDKQCSGQHQGRGPKGYTRCDDRIREDVNDRLSDDRFVDVSEIEVTVSSRRCSYSAACRLCPGLRYKAPGCLSGRSA